MYSKHKNIIILDACNYNEFEKVINETNFIGELTKVNTGCSTTQQWYNKYWSSKRDRILISENPMPFHKSTNAHVNFKENYKSFGDTWMDIDPHNTIKRYRLCDRDNNFLIHFLSPHLPFIYPEKAVALMSRLRKGNIYRNTQNWGINNSFGKLKEFYKLNIRNMLNIIYENLYLFEDLVITSDHGELVGYMDRQYDHPHSPDNKQKEILHNVPYYKVDIEETLLNERMRMLGYH